MQVQCNIIEEHQLCEEEAVKSVAIEESSNSSRFTDTYTFMDHGGTGTATRAS